MVMLCAGCLQDAYVGTQRRLVSHGIDLRTPVIDGVEAPRQDGTGV